MSTTGHRNDRTRAAEDVDLVATHAQASSAEPDDGPPPLVADVAGLRAFLDGPHAAVRDEVRRYLPRQADLLDESRDLPRDELRQRVRDLAAELGATGLATRGFPADLGGGGDVGGSVAAFEALALGDLSVLVKTGVQYGLFGGALLQLGTRRHHEALLPDVLAGRLLGCFAMTETGHGSNVQALRTVAVHDPVTDELVVTTPDDDARKDYIGGAARDGELAVVFAQLEVDGERHGVHALLVPIRGRRCTGTGGADRGLRGQARARGGRQRAAVVRRRPGAAREPARPLRRHRRQRPVPLEHRGPGPPVLHHARHPRAGPGERRWRGGERREGGRDNRGPLRAAPPAVRGPHPGRRVAAARPRDAPAPAAPARGAHLRALCRPGGGGAAAARGVLPGHPGRRRAGPT